MLSLYIHIPFCDRKCGYCSFHVMPMDQADDKLIDAYVSAVCEEIQLRAGRVEDKQLKTLYLGGGTPTRIGLTNLQKIIDTVMEHFDCELLGELSIECNPYPQEEIYSIIQSIQKKYKDIPRIRRSIGVQTFDGEILQESGRLYSFPAIREFLRHLPSLKKDNSVFNFDFIAFGKFNQTKKGDQILRDQARQEFFYEFVESHFADSFSVYTLELFPGSTRYNEQIAKTSHANSGLGLKKYGSDDDVYDEFQFLKSILLDAGYSRYEISNFALVGKSSIHNRVYRNMEDYIGIGTSAASFIDLQRRLELTSHFTVAQKAIRWTNTSNIRAYVQGKEHIAQQTLLSDKDYRIENFFLGLRTDRGVQDIDSLADILVPDYQSKLQTLQDNGYIIQNSDKRKLTDHGLDIYNTIVTDLLAEI